VSSTDPLPPQVVNRIRGPVVASVRSPGSKSLTNRYLVLAALCRGEGVLRHPLVSDDTDRLLAAIETLGLIVRPEGPVVRIDGGDGRFPDGGSIDLGAGGTPTRFMIAAATRARRAVDIDGSPRMRERPIAEGVALVESIGGRVDWLDRVGHLPIRVHPSEPLPGGVVEVGRTASSQFVSALLLVAPTTQAGVEVRFREPPTSPTYLELTIDALRRVGAAVEVERDRDGGLASIRVPSGVIPSFDLDIEPDASSAVYPAMLAAGLPGSRIEILGLPADSVQPDAAAIDALAAFGATVERRADRAIVSYAGPLRGVDLDASDFPDAAVGLAALAAIADGPSRFVGLHTLRVKECDRVMALATELRKIGCGVEEGPDSLSITPVAPGPIDETAPRVRIARWDDHRMAMAFAVVGAIRGGIEVDDPGCVAKSHPGFWDELARLGAAADPVL
jgi:3-phosphoshikimate 1-carboxyvinyltransferase